jgi:putative CocE/NonD family hydrolase
MHRARHALIVLMLLGARINAAAPEEPAPRHLADLQAITRTDYVMLPMRDGTRLFTVVMQPTVKPAKSPTILIRTPYNLGMEVDGLSQGLLLPLAKKGYVIVVQNERGSLLSEGEFHLMGGARKDGYDTLDWISHQDWSNGKVGTIGCSSSGDNQLPLAAERHPAHAAMVTMSSGTAFLDIPPFRDRGGFYRGGSIEGPWLSWFREYGLIHQPKLPAGADADALRRYGDWYSAANERRIAPGLPVFDYEATMRTLPLTSAMQASGGGTTDYGSFVRRQPDDPAWNMLTHFRAGDQLGVPGLWVMHLFDIGIDGMMAGFEHVRRETRDARVRHNQFAVVGPLGHCSFLQETEHSVAGDRAIGDARFAYGELIERWFAHWLEPAGKAGSFDAPAVQVYLSGHNAWQSFTKWPHPGTRASAWFLASGGHANSRLGDGRLLEQPAQAPGTDTFVYDPMHPVPTTGGTLCCSGSPQVKPGSIDQSALELRGDVLVYTSAPLVSALDTIGWGEATVYLSSDAPDTDLTVKVVDVAPEGPAFNIGESIQRVRWRNGFAKPELMKTGEVYPVRIGPFFLSNRFEPGHRVRVEIASSNFPGFERNLNTGGNNAEEVNVRIARNTVHYSTEHPS